MSANRRPGAEPGPSLDEILAQAERALFDEPAPPAVLACPGCTDLLVQCGDHGRCAEHGCWTDGLSRIPVYCVHSPRP